MMTALFLISALFPAAEKTAKAETWDRYMTALGWVESRNNDYAVGRSGEIGRYQILEPYWRDSGMRWGTYKDCRNARYAGTVVWFYAMSYEWKALQARDWYVLAALHHQGRFWRQADPAERERYWANVKKAMNDGTMKARKR